MGENQQYQQQLKQVVETQQLDAQTEPTQVNSIQNSPRLEQDEVTSPYADSLKRRKTTKKISQAIVGGALALSATMLGAKEVAPIVSPAISSLLSRLSTASNPQQNNSLATTSENGTAASLPNVDSAAKKTDDTVSATLAQEQNPPLPDNSINSKDPKDWTSANWQHNLPGSNSSLSPDISPTYVTNPTLNSHEYGVTYRIENGKTLLQIGSHTYNLDDVFSQRLNLPNLPFSNPKEFTRMIAASDPLGGVAYYYQVDPKSGYEGASAGFLFLDNYGQKGGNSIPFDVTLLQIPEQVWNDPYFIENPSKLQDIIAHTAVNGHEMLASFVNSPGRTTNEKVLYYSTIDPAHPVSELIDTGLSHINVSRLQNSKSDWSRRSDLKDLNGFVITGFTKEGKFAIEFIHRDLSQGVPQLKTEIIGDSVPIIKNFEADNRVAFITTNSVDSSQPNSYHSIHLNSDELTQNSIDPKNIEIALTQSGNIAGIFRGPVKENGKQDVYWTLATREQVFKPTITRDVPPGSVNSLVGIEQ